MKSTAWYIKKVQQLKSRYAQLQDVYKIHAHAKDFVKMAQTAEKQYQIEKEINQYIKELGIN